MKIVDDDVDYALLDWKRFEELCFDLLVKYQFHSLIWRQGGADAGRDIEANFTASNSLTGPYTEKWYIECKHHKKGLEITDINTKIEWATVGDIDHFLLITTSYLTKSTREWLNAKRKSLNFRVHLIEGKELKSKLLQFPDLVNMYFLDDYLALVKSAYRNWVTHNIWLEPKALNDLRNSLDVRRLSLDEFVFIWFNFLVKEEDIELYCEDVDIELFDYDFLLPFVSSYAVSNKPIISKEEASEFGIRPFYNGLTSSRTDGSEYLHYCNFPIDGHGTIEAFLLNRNKITEARIGLNTVTKKDVSINEAEAD